jgi:hypothetical protein
MLRLLFRLPWYGFVVAGLVLFALAGKVYVDVQADEAAKARALAAPPPAAVPLDRFDSDRDIHIAREVHVTAWVNVDHTYTLTEHHTGRGPDYDVVRRMFVLFGPDDSADSTVARAVMLLTENQVPDLADYAMANLALTTDGGVPEHPVFTLQGEATGLPTLHAMADEALDKQGLTKSPDFIFIDPWLNGRAAALAPTPGLAGEIGGAVSVLGLFSLLIAAVKFRRRNRKPVLAATPVLPRFATPAAAPVPMSPFGLMRHQAAGLSDQDTAQSGASNAAAQAVTPPEPAPRHDPLRWLTSWRAPALGVSCMILGTALGFTPLTWIGLVLILARFALGSLRKPLRGLMSVQAMAGLRPRATPPVADAPRAQVRATGLQAWIPFAVGCGVMLVAPLVIPGALPMPGLSDLFGVTSMPSGPQGAPTPGSIGQVLLSIIALGAGAYALQAYLRRRLAR